MDVLRKICHRSVVFLRHEAIALGYDDRALARSVRSEAIHRVRRGSYVFRDQWDSLDGPGRHLVLTAAALRTAEAEMVLSHVTAAVAHDVPIWDLPLDEVHLTRTDGRAGRRAAGIVQHSGALPRDHVVLVHGVPVTSPARTAFDVAATTDVEHSLCVVNDLLHRKLVTRAQLNAISTQMARVPGSLGVDLTFRLADGRCESIGESRSLYMFWMHSLPAPELQYEIYDEHGLLVAVVDFAWPELGLFVEFAGRIKYERLRREGESVTDVVLREKKREALICRLTGWRCHRIVWADLYRPVETCAIIRSMMSPTAV